MLTSATCLELLCPLKHPSELPTHPSLSQPYTSQALEQMTAGVEEKLRKERALLWRARNLHRQFLGDGGWMPCGIIETPEDCYIFEPKNEHQLQSASADQRGTSSTGGELNGAPDVSSSTSSRGADQAQSGTEGELHTTTKDVEMGEATGGPAGQGEINTEPEESNMPLKAEETDSAVNDLPPHPKGADDLAQDRGDDSGANGRQPKEMDISRDSDKPMLETASADPNGIHGETEQDAEMQDGSSPEPPRRMTTRAQANATNPQDDGNRSPLSPADTANSLPTPHPLFLIPNNVRPDANFGLPASEAEETRRLLWSYIQKQEETVRGFEHMLDSLLRACQMKADVLEWCKAEGHVGEMSDGEDWYDREKWGLAEGEDLKKGTDEDEVETVDDSRTTAKRGRGRRA